MATNHIDIFDSVQLRPGRIDRKIKFPPPGTEACAPILRIHFRKVRPALQQLYFFLFTLDVVTTQHQPALAEKCAVLWCSGAPVRGMYALREQQQQHI
ncbi:hypothetical protein B0H11DRAFT_2238697 [Mycena galericulata]|nr:hypothetical protein B0H11DRAFT_2238697 [Mycena galericulata]